MIFSRFTEFLSFNPRARMRRDRMLDVTVQTILFQSTRPYEARLHAVNILLVVVVSIHAPV